MIHRTKRNHTERKKDSREKRVYIKEEKDHQGEKGLKGVKRLTQRGKRIHTRKNIHTRSERFTQGGK